MPKITVLMSVYNGEKYLSSAIESILSQTEENFEFIIINDGSSDSSLRIIQDYAVRDKRIVVVNLERTGFVGALNYGLNIAKGEYIARMDADDIAYPDRLNIQLQFLNNNINVAGCGGWAMLIDKNGENISELTYPPLQYESIKRGLILHNTIIHPTLMVRTAVLKSVGGYRKFYRHIEDYELWSRLLPHHQIVNLDKKLIKYRQHLGQITLSKNFQMRFRGVLVRLLVIWRVKFGFYKK